jgi:hypothetical protein
VRQWPSGDLVAVVRRDAQQAQGHLGEARRGLVAVRVAGGDAHLQVAPGARRETLVRVNRRAVAVRTAYAPSAAYFTMDDPNLLLARVHQRARR